MLDRLITVVPGSTLDNECAVAQLTPAAKSFLIADVGLIDRH